VILLAFIDAFSRAVAFWIALLDTVCMKDSAIQPRPAQSCQDWQKSPYANLIRYIPSGTYYARLSVKGKLIRKSLKTTVLSVAKLRLTDFERQERKRAEAGDAVAQGKMTVGDAIAIHKERVAGDVSLKPRTKDYHGQRIKALLKSWPGLDKRLIRDLSPNDCKTWAAKFGKTASPTAFNHTVGIFRCLLAIGCEVGARYDNPAKDIKRAPERAKQLVLPSPEQFEKFVLEIERGGSRDSQNCADLVRFLAFGGFRKGEAAQILWADCDLKKGEILVRGDAETGTKNWSVRRVPMIPDMIALLAGLKAERPTAKPTDPVMLVRECQGAMNRAAAHPDVAMPRITHHDLRHLFATRCIESGVDIPTVSRWLGHKDGGALAMRVYGHLRDHHSVTMAQRVTFTAPAEPNVVPLLIQQNA
jgi:integrase